MINYYIYDTDILGKIAVFEENDYIIRLSINTIILPSNSICNESDIIKTAYKELTEYINGTRSSFTVPYKLYGTDFQLKVWQYLLTIPYGKTISYKDIALSINHPKSYRAVGSACGKNPLLIFIPCHRVINNDKKISGYAGGINLKKILLSLEGKYLYK